MRGHKETRLAASSSDRRTTKREDLYASKTTWISNRQPIRATANKSYRCNFGIFRVFLYSTYLCVFWELCLVLN